MWSRRMPLLGVRERATVERIVGAVCVLAMSIGILGYLILQSFSLLPHQSDDGLYAYQANLILAGRIPYRDFFLAHPPVHVLLTAAAFLLAGEPGVAAARAVVVISGVVQALCVVLLIRRGSSAVSGGRPPAHGALVAVAAGLALLLSHGFLVLSSFDTGVVQAMALVAVGSVLLASGRTAAAGVLAGFAGLTALQTLPTVLVLGIASFWLGRGRRFALAAIATIAFGQGLSALIGGAAFFDQVYGFHLAKESHSGEAVRCLRDIVFDNWEFLIGALLGAVVALIRLRGLARGIAAFALAAMAVHIGSVLLLPRCFHYYLLPILPAGAAAIGMGLLAAADIVFDVEAAPAHRKLDPRRAGLAVLTIAFLGFPFASADIARAVLGKDRLGPDHLIHSYTWTDAPLLGPLNRPVRSLFWNDGQREQPRRYGSITEYLWFISRWTDAHPELVRAVQKEAAANPATTLVGDVLTVPAVAIAAGVPITEDFADTNSQRFAAGAASIRDFCALLDRNRSALVLLADRPRGIHAAPDVMDHLNRHYIRSGVFNSRPGYRHILYRPRPDPAGAEP